MCVFDLFPTPNVHICCFFNPRYTSAVEDVFFLVQKCSRRAIATGHGDIACAIFNNINNTLNEDLYQLFVRSCFLSFSLINIDFKQTLHRR
jgi:hypothetical protein